MQEVQSGAEWNFLIQVLQEVQNAGGAKRCRVEFFLMQALQEVQNAALPAVQAVLRFFLIQKVQEVLRFFWVVLQFFFEIFRFFFKL